MSELRKSYRRSQTGGKPRSSKSKLQNSRHRSQKGGKPRSSKSKLQNSRRRSQKGGKPRSSKSKLQNSRRRSQKGGKPLSIFNIPKNINNLIKNIPGISKSEIYIHQIYEELKKGKSGNNKPESCIKCEECSTTCPVKYLSPRKSPFKKKFKLCIKCRNDCKPRNNKRMGGDLFEDCNNKLCIKKGVSQRPNCSNKYSKGIYNFTKLLGQEQKICLNCAGVISVKSFIHFIWGYLQWYVNRQSIKMAHGAPAAQMYTDTASIQTITNLTESVIENIKYKLEKKPSKAGVITLRHLKKIGLAPDED